MTEVTTQTCRICNEVKPIELFERDKRTPTGYTRRCKACKFEGNKKPAKAFRRLYERQKFRELPIETDLQEFEVLFELCGDRCAYCWDEFTGTPTLDHVIPISHPNSTNHISNFQLVCKTCNAGKRDKPLLAFYKDNPRFQKANLDGVIKIYAYFAKKSIEEIEEMFQRDYEEWKKSKSVASI